MPYSPTIIAASLNDEELKKSIDGLVTYVNKKMGEIGTSIDNPIKNLEQKLRSLGNKNIDMGGAADGGSSRRTKKQVEEKQAVDGTTVSYQNLEAAKQKATGTSPAQDSYQEFVKNMRQNVALLAMEIKDMPNWSLDKQFGNYMQYERQIEQTRQRIQELKQELQNVGSDPNGSRLVIKQITEQIAQEQQKLVQLQKEQITTTKQIELADKQALAQKQAQYETEKKALVDMSVGKREIVTFGEKQASQEAKITDEIRRQADEIRKSAEWKKHGTYEIYDKETNTTYRVSKQIELSIEEQILNIQKEKNNQIYQSEIEQQKNNSALRENLETERLITQEREKRKKYIAPSISTEMDMRSYLKFARDRANSEILSYNELTSSSKRLNDALKQQQRIYSTLTADERTHPFGQTTLANIQGLQRALHNLNAQMSRPMSLASINAFHPKTLDDIAYKIQMLQRYRSGIDITKPNASKEIDSVNKAIAELTKKQRELLGTNKSLFESNNALARSWNYMKNRLAFYFTVGASTAFVKNLIDVRSQYELLERSMGILFDSMQTGTKIFAELNAMALKSPFTTMELGYAAKQLSAYNIAAKDVVDTTRRLADMAAAVGIPIERLTYALGQIKSYGYLNSRDQRMFANAGIPLVQSLADMYSKLEGRLVSMGDVYDRIKKKQVSFEDTMKVINEMTDEGGRFFDFQAKSADTLKVRLANLTLAWNNMLNELGKDSQGVISGTLGGAKVLFDNWRKINNVIVSIITEIGVLKGLQLLILALNKKLLVQKEVELVLGKKITQTIWNTASAMKALAVNPMTWLTLVATTLTYMAWQWYDIKKAAEEFNKTIAKNAQENIDSINKFYSQYAKDIETVTSLQQADQQKLWERVREEIEKTSKNAKQYIETLELIPNIAERVIGGKETLDQIKVIEQEVKRISEQDIFNVGGGFADDSLAEDLEEYDKAVKSITKNYKSLQDALNWHRTIQTGKELSGLAGLPKYWKLDAQVSDIREANSELDKFVAKLGSADLQRVMGSGDAKTQIANLREFAHIIRDNFLATEQGQKVGIEGQAKLNASLDRWIALQAKAKNLLDDEQISIELHRSAWEQFFDTLNEEERKRVDYLVRTNQLGSEEFKKIWDNAAEHLKKSSETSYQQIQEQIADLRGTAPIVIDVIYKERREQKDAQQELFEADLITPKYVKGNGNVVTADDYFAELTKLRAKYGRFNKKEGEDNVDWEKRLGEEYQSNAQKIKTLNNQLENSATLSEIDRKAKENDRDSLVGINDVLKQIENRENFDYSQFAKGGKSGGSKKDELGDALTKELQLITDIQKLYKEYTKAGVDSETAKNAAAKEYQKTLEQTNNTLSKFGVQGLTGEQLATMDLRSMLDYYQSILDKVQSSPKAVEALEKAIRNLNVEITKEGQKTIIDSLNSELSKLKDEYELAVELDANPELGSAFAETFGIDVSGLPRTIEEVVSRAQSIVDEKLGKEGLFNVLTGDIEALRETMGHTIDSGLIDAVEKAQKSVRDLWKKDAQETISDWNKLLEKYAEYEYKRTQIIQQAEREHEIARKKNAGDDVHRAIDIKKQRELARLDFEQFQRSPEWILATGDLATLTDKALGTLIKDLEEYKKKAKNLDPKQIKQLNDALKKLRNQQRQGNPFLAIKRAFEEAAEKGETANQTVKELTERWMELKRKQSQSDEGIFLTESERKELDKLPEEIDKAQKKANEAGKVSAQAMVAAINEMLQPINMVTGAIGDMFSAFGNTEAAENIKKVSSMLDKAVSFAAMGASIGGGWGAAIGGVVGLLVGGISAFADEISGNASITRQVERSERAVRRLELAYIDLERAIEKAYGTEEYHAIKLAQANKQAQLLELKRQLQLEQSRSSKNKDEDKILDLQKQINELENDIKDSLENITNDFLGISSVGDAIEDMVGSMIDSFRNGEDAMASFEENIDEMIASMAKKLFSEKILDTWFKDVWNKVNSGIVERTAEYEKELAKLDSDFKYRSQTIGDEAWDAAMEVGGVNEEKYNEFIADFLQNYYTKREYLLEQIAEGSKVSIDDLFEYAEMLKSGYPIVQAQFEEFKEKLSQLLPIKDGVGDNLSALQQGIQSLSEDTGNAIESYLNGISQQIYLHSSQLEEIKALMQGWNFDVSLGTMSQVLLQLQSSYQVQMTIQNTLLGWSSPNGMSVRVEMV